MAGFLDKVKVNTAITKFNKFDLSCDHITTTDWMHLSPIYNKEMVPKEKLSVNVEAMSRLAPLAVPTFGRGNINMRAFFVPYRTIFPAWNDFISDLQHTPYNTTLGVSNMVTSVPTVSNRVLQGLFVTPVGGNTAYTSLVEPNSGVYDYVYVDNEDNVHYLKLTPKGRRVMKIIESLGYKIQWKSFSTANEPTYSALPILAYAKVYCDWYWPQAYPEALNAIEPLFKQDTESGTNTLITTSSLLTLFELADLVCYDSDYFTAAWDNPTAPNEGSFSSISIPDITNGTSADAGLSVIKTDPSIVTVNGTPWISRASGSPSSNGAITQFAIDALKAATDYMKRHLIAGAKALDRFFARFGTVLPAEKLNRSVYIGSKLVPIQIGDVTSTSDTTGLSKTNDPYGYDRLGAYAGRGVGYGQGNFDFQTDEYGMFIICSSLVPNVGYYQGIDRSIMHKNKLDFWTPEFDQLGSQAISVAELLIPTDGQYESDVMINDAVFGFAPRYAEYKIAKDKVTGDYRYDSTNKSLMTNNGWHFMRQFPDSIQHASEQGSYSPNWLAHSAEFVKGTDANQFNRIFQAYSVDEQMADHFSMIYHFDVGMVAPMAKLWDTYDFDDSDSGKEVTMDVNGVKMN